MTRDGCTPSAAATAPTATVSSSVICARLQLLLVRVRFRVRVEVRAEVRLEV